ncbi:MAG: alanine/glycine:cation symporter family protein [Salibacteraceae bacterium]
MIDAAFEPVVNFLDAVLFWDPFTAIGIYDPVVYDSSGEPVINDLGQPMEKKIPIVVVWLMLGALFFTLRMGFVNIRGIKHAIQLVRGKYDNPSDEGEVTHFQALATALSGTVGLGNIAGVAVAIALGGAGATFWMIVAGFFGMSSKFVECTLGVKYRQIDAEGRVSGGPMYYLTDAMAKKGYAKLGKVLAALFAILCIGGSFGGGNMFQANQALEQVTTKFPEVSSFSLLGIDGPVWFGIILAVFVGLVIIGGIKSIAKVTDKIVPLMVGTYVLFALIIIGLHIDNIGNAFGEIFYGAFDADALKGGFIGVMITGFQRAAFSNEAGVGSASIAHSASKTKRPVSEGLVALMEPFIDTVVVCTMTALVLIFTGYADDTSGLKGAALTSAAFSDVFSWFDWVLLIAIILFAFSTMISWSYYGLKSWTFLLGENKYTVTSYKIVFLIIIIVGSASSLGNVIAFSDMMILGMAFPNILGLYFLSSEVRKDLKTYFHDLKTGAFKAYK